MYCSISFSSTFHVISRKFGLLFGQCSNYFVSKKIHFSRYNMKCSGDNVILRGIVFHYISCYIMENGFSARQKFGLLFGQCSNRRNQQHFLSLAVRCLYCFRFHFIDFWPKTASIQFNSIWPPCGQIILYLYNIICILLLL